MLEGCQVHLGKRIPPRKYSNEDWEPWYSKIEMDKSIGVHVARHKKRLREANEKNRLREANEKNEKVAKENVKLRKKFMS